MRKSFGFYVASLLVLLVVLIGLCACESTPASSSTPDASSSEPSSSADVSGEDNSGVVTTPPVEVELTPVTFTEEHKTAMLEELTGYKYMSFSQEMENGITGQAKYSTTRYSLSVNLEQNIHSLTMRYITVDGISRDALGYKLYSDGTNYIVSEDGKWVEAGEEYETLAWDLTQFTSASDVVSNLMHEVQWPVDKEGTSTGDYWTFEYTEATPESLLVGIEYDELLDVTYKFMFSVKDDKPIPSSIVVNIGYKIGEEEYYVESTLRFYSFGNTKITIPAVGSDS